MALKVKAKEREIKIGKNPGVYRYVMLPELYSTLDQDKVIKEAALRSGVTEGVMQACWDGAGKVIKAWATEGHSVALPGLGTMRFGLRAKAVENVNDVKTSLIKTCYDRNGEEVKRVTSSDPGTVEDPDPSTPSTGSGTENGGNPSAGSGSSTGSETGGSGNNSGGSGIIPTPTDPEDDQPGD